MRHTALRYSLLAVLVLGTSLCVGCRRIPGTGIERATLGYRTAIHSDLVSLPRPRLKTIIAVYKFRDQTGQYKQSAQSTTFSTAISQGATSMLNKALEDTGWFTVIEREGLNNLLNERRIIQSTRTAYQSNNAQASPLPPMLYAGVLLEGGIISYDTNIITGGMGIRYFGAGGHGRMQKDQVSVYLRLISVTNGRILKTVTATKSIMSREVDVGVYRYVREKRLLEMEAGFSTNEPASMCVLEAIEKAVFDLVIEGIQDGIWQLENPEDINHPVIQAHLRDKGQVAEAAEPNEVPEEPEKIKPIEPNAVIPEPASAAVQGPEYLSDNDESPNEVGESANNGTPVGLTAWALDPNIEDTISYSLDDSADGRFQVNLITGAITVKDRTLLDYESQTQHNITVRATSTDGSSITQPFTIKLLDDKTESTISPITDGDASSNEITEGADNDTPVGITAVASDGDATDTISYRLDDDAQGCIRIHPDTGVVTVANSALLERLNRKTINITVRATSSDGSSATQLFTIQHVTVPTDFPISPITDNDGVENEVSESASIGTRVGITAFAAYRGETAGTVSYRLSDDAEGRFQIYPITGVITVKDSSLLDFESQTSHSLTVRAASTDGSSITQLFTVKITDDNTEFAIESVTDGNAAQNTVSEGAANGTSVGIMAHAVDGDTMDKVSYKLEDDAKGRFQIHAGTGIITLKDRRLLDYERHKTHTVIVRATSTDGSSTTQSFTIQVSDDNAEFPVGPVMDSDARDNTIPENAPDGTLVGITALAGDSDTADRVTYTLDDDADACFQIDAVTGVVTVRNGNALDYERQQTLNITVRATSTDGSFSTQSLSINLVDDHSEHSLGPVMDTDTRDNRVSENAEPGTAVGIRAQAIDNDSSDTVSYALDGQTDTPFQINPNTGHITVKDNSGLDYETQIRYTVTVRATSKDGSTQTQSFTLTLIDDITEFPLGPVRDDNAAENVISESALPGTPVGITALALDGDKGDTIVYTLADNPGDRFEIDPTSGIISVRNNRRLDYEKQSSHSITVKATSADGESTQSFIIRLTDDNAEFTVGPISDSNPANNEVMELAGQGTPIGITTSADDDDSSDSVTYTLTDDAGARFQIDQDTGVITVNESRRLQSQNPTTYTVTVQATSTDGSSRTQSFEIDLLRSPTPGEPNSI